MTKNRAKTALYLFLLAILFFITSRYVMKFFFLFFLIALVCLVLGVSILKGDKNKKIKKS